MTEDGPSVADLLAAANHLCTFCTGRLSRFLGAHTQHPHETNADTLRRINDLAGACCVKWKGHEPDHWAGRPA